MLPRVVRCDFDTDGDGKPDLSLADADGNGFCEWPDLKTDLHTGTLRFTAATPVEFQGTTLIEAARIIVEDGAVLKGDPDRLQSLTLVATAGDFVSSGTLDLSVSNDLTIRSLKGGITLAGSVQLEAADALALDARLGDLTVAPQPSLAFTLLAGNAISLTANGVKGSLGLTGALLGSRRITLDSTASSAPTGFKGITIDGGLLTTDAALAGFTGSAYPITLKGARGTGVPAGFSAVNLRNGAVLQSGANVVLTTQQTGDNACLFNQVSLTAKGGSGYIDFSAVKGKVYDSGTIFKGILKSGDKVVSGSCP